MSHPVNVYSECDSNGIPIINLAALRVAQQEMSSFPAVSSPWSSLPKWCQEAIQYSMNEVFKVHYAAAVSLRKALETLVAHRSQGSFPQVVLAAVPGVKNFHIDNTLSDENKSLLSQQLENTTRQARSSYLNTIIESKDLALKVHELKCSSAFVLVCCRDRLFDSLHLMGKTIDAIDPSQLNAICRALCHLQFQMAERLDVQAWHKAQQARKQQKSVSAADAVMDHTNDLSPAALNESIEKIVRKAVDSRVSSLNNSLKKLSLASSRGSRGPSRGPSRGSSGGSRSSGPSRSGKGSRPSVPRSSQGRVQKGAPRPQSQSSGKKTPSGPRRLAPAPTPFKQLKGKRG